jgi:hypothetical protein
MQNPPNPIPPAQPAQKNGPRAWTLSKIALLKNWRDPQARRRLIRATIVALAVIGLLFAVDNVTSGPLTCGLCHEIKPEVAGWHASVHSTTGCYECHPTYGPFYLGESKTDLFRDIYKHFSGRYVRPVNSNDRLAQKIIDSTCTRCHEPSRAITPAKGILMKHKLHIDKHMPCTRCHNRVAHPGVPGHPDNAKMQACFRGCHGQSKDATATGVCRKCHTPDFKLTPGPDQGEFNHETKTWVVPDHGKLATVAPEMCNMCHLPTFCWNCHHIQMPHPPRKVWVLTKFGHGRVGQTDKRVCAKCHHDAADPCEGCHHKVYNVPGSWKQNHHIIVKKQGFASCFQVCHSATYCAYCHVKGVAPPNGAV